jgi:hypothetical protein
MRYILLFLLDLMVSMLCVSVAFTVAFHSESVGLLVGVSYVMGSVYMFVHGVIFQAFKKEVSDG